jgi:predicted acyltransferase
MTRIARRLASIDAFRAITMLLMIFVNDLILVDKAPTWLEHAEQGEDRLGLADTVFPAFLFIVGLSIPLAIGFMQERGLTKKETLWNIVRRGSALLVMGIFIVNYEDYTTGPALLSKWWWMLLMTIAFFFTWLVYPASWSRGRKAFFRGIGISGLVVLAMLYKGGTAEHPIWIQTHWYGILGLIGWVYLICALLYVYIGDRLPVLAAAFFIFLGMSIAWNGGWLKALDPKPVFWWEDGIGLCAFAMAGIMTTVYYRRAVGAGASKALQSLLRLTMLALVLLVAGFALRPVGGIAKLDVTPSWVLICTAISIACFVLLAFVVDISGRDKWYRLIRPAGTITLTCYLLPYLHFALFKILGYRLPMALRTGWTGVFKSLVFAFIIVLIAGVFEKKKIKLAV